MILQKRLEAFVKLGELIQNLSNDKKEALFDRAAQKNSWFTQSNCEEALSGIAHLLNAENLKTWVSKYPLENDRNSLKVGILMAGNIPMVGFHDLMTVLVSGHEAHVKLSSADQVLMTWLIEQIIAIEPEFGNRIQVAEMLKAKDAYIATGSDNSARYFNYYFGKYPSIIRQNRTSVAILDGEESEDDLRNLGKDIFQYFGLGCRNVSKIFVKEKTQLQQLLAVLEEYKEVAEHHKYHNNYEYNKSIYLVNSEPHLDNGFLILKESLDLVSPIAVLYYELYEEEELLRNRLDELKDKIQCIVSDPQRREGAIHFGTAQSPDVWDYADGVDTMKFLMGLG